MIPRPFITDGLDLQYHIAFKKVFRTLRGLRSIHIRDIHIRNLIRNTNKQERLNVTVHPVFKDGWFWCQIRPKPFLIAGVWRGGLNGYASTRGSLAASGIYARGINKGELLIFRMAVYCTTTTSSRTAA